MRIVNGVIALVLIALSLLHLDEPDRLIWMTAYAVGAALAGVSCLPNLNCWTMRILGTVSTVVMFLYFAGFFFRVPHLGAQWYATEGAEGTIALGVAGLAMLPVVAAFTCELKRQADAEGT